MRVRNNWSKLALVSAICLSMFAVMGHAAALTPRILLVGDSWTNQIWDNRILKDVLDDNGFTDVDTKGANTAIGGTTASWWAQSANLQVITNELNTYSTIDIVHISLGGNDFLGGWNTSLSSAQEDALFAQIQSNLQTVVNHILAHNANMKVVICDYDYLNFVESVVQSGNTQAQALWLTMGQPSQRQLNDALTDLGLYKLSIAQNTSRCEYVQNWGTNHYRYGYPGWFSAGLTAYPGQYPSFSPYPGGNIDFPSHPDMMRGTTYIDPIHLSNTGYYWILENCFAMFYYQWLLGPKAHSPSPSSSATGVSTTADLSWGAGAGATAHKVYFGTSLTYRGQQTSTTYDPGTMSNSTTYYWRIDEVNAGGTTTGDVWNFTTQSSGCSAGPIAMDQPVSKSLGVAMVPLLMALLALAAWWGIKQKRATC